jgi:hypothetical protein
VVVQCALSLTHVLSISFVAFLSRSACGACEYCAKQQFSLCDRTNVAGASGGAGGSAATGDTMEKLYGHRTAALFGYAMAGQVPGLQVGAGGEVRAGGEERRRGGVRRRVGRAWAGWRKGDGAG